MKTINKKAVLITVIMVLAACMMWHMTVLAKGNQIPVDRDSLLEIEETYKENIRRKLDGMGYNNAGITVTSICDGDGKLYYSSKIHHKRIDKMSDPERILLKKELDQFAFKSDSYKFEHEFLIYEEE